MSHPPVTNSPGFVTPDSPARVKRAPARGFKHFIAAFAAFLLAFGGLLGGVAAPAQAAPPEWQPTANGISSALTTTSGESVSGPVKEGTKLRLRVQYGEQTKSGSKVVIDLGVYAGNLDPQVPANNDAIESFTVNPDNPSQVIIVFKDPIPKESNQGVLDIEFAVKANNGSSSGPVEWKVDGSPFTTELTILSKDDEVGPSTEDAKKTITSGGGLSGLFDLNQDTKQVTLKAGTGPQTIGYKLFVQTAGPEAGYSISDTLPEGMTLNPDSFATTQTVWDENGLNKKPGTGVFSPSSSTASSFAGTMDFPSASKTEISYTATLSVAALEKMAADLTAKYQAKTDADLEKDGSVSIDGALWNNAAELDGKKVNARPSASVGWKGIPSVNVGVGFGKTVNSPWGIEVLDANGQLKAPVDLEYTLKADLRQWDGSTKFKPLLKQNVIITDTLPAGMAFHSPLKISATGLTGFQEASPAPANAEAFAADAYVGQYWVDGKVLRINVGKDKNTNALVKVGAQVVDVTALPLSYNNGDGQLAVERREAKNTATFNYTKSDSSTTQDTHSTDATHVVVIQEDKPNSGINDSNAFTKSSPATLVVKKGESAEVPYTFEIKSKANVDLSKSKIVDYVDLGVFDLSDVSAIADKVTGSFGNAQLGKGDIALSHDGEGQLTVTLTEAGLAKVEGQSATSTLRLVLPLPTHPVVGKQSITLTNSATLFGADNTPLFWDDAKGEATSFGDEAEVRKTLWDGKQKTQYLRAEYEEVDGKQVLKKKRYVYNIDFLPRGNYNFLPIKTVTDTLPAGTNFAGFVEQDDVDTGEVKNPSQTDRELGSGIHARFIKGENGERDKVEIYQKDGVLDKSKLPIQVNIAVDINEFTPDVPVSNLISGSEANIVPTNEEGAPLLVKKVDSKNLNITISDRDARFEVRDAQGELITDQAFVSNGKVMVDDGKGGAKLLYVPTPAAGKSAGYTIKETVAPAGYELNPEPITAYVNSAGVTSGGLLANDPILYALGDYTWIDSNKNGLQDDGEKPLAGVTVVLLLEDGKTPAPDQFGDSTNSHGSPTMFTTTDENGRYVFDNVRPGTYRVAFVLGEDDAKKYKFTTPNVHTGDAADTNDSDGEPYVDEERPHPDTAMTPAFELGVYGNSDEKRFTSLEDYLKEGNVKPFEAKGGIDQTRDAGVVEKDYAIGDYTWIDTDRDGKQGKDEPVLPGVTVTLLNADGTAVKNPDGSDKVTVTNEQGFYLFDELPAGEYRVKFDYSTVKPEHLSWAGRTDLTAADFVFTSAGDAAKGDNTDSDADRQTGITSVFTVGPVGDANQGSIAVGDYSLQEGVKAIDAINPTIDAGIVLKNYAVGDYVWVDGNRDGIQDKDEVILEGVGVELYSVDKEGNLTPAKDADGNDVAPATTDEKGKYLFENLPSGDYQVKFILTDEQAETYRYTLVGQGEGDDQDRHDSDARVENNDPKSKTAFTETFTLNDENPFLAVEDGVNATQGIDRTRDAGVSAPTYAIGDKVWYDDDRDGVQDFDGENPEKPVANVTVKLFGKDQDPSKDEPLATTTTDENGNYHFDGLPEGEYTVKFELPEDVAKDYTFTTQNSEGTDPKQDSDAKPTTGITKKITLGPANTELVTNPGDYPGLENMDATEGIDPTWDAGIVKKSYAVGDIAWIDENRDGLQNFEGDKPEKILPGVTVEIFAIETDDEGNTKQVPAKHVDGVDVAPVVTDENGRYVFNELPAGQYQVKFTLTEDQSKAFTFTRFSPETGGRDDSNAERTTGLSPVFALDDSNSQLTRDYADQEWKSTQGIDPTWDAGVVKKTYALGDKVFYDEDRDGVQDENEPPVPGVTVYLEDENGDPVLDPEGNPTKTVTNDEGEYLFEELPPGKYTVRFELPEDLKEDYDFTTPNTGSEDDKDDSDPDRETGRTPVIELGPDNPNLVPSKEYGNDEQKSTEGIDPTWDAGIVKKSYAIGDYTWIDLNQDGKQTEGEPVLPGVKVTLTDPEGNPVKDMLGNEVAPVFTDENGKYVFDELPAGKYVVGFELTPEQAKRYSFTTTGEGSATDSDGKVSENPAVSFTQVIELDSKNPHLDRKYGVKASQGIDPTWDAGVIQKSVRVGDYVWVDTDKDGRQDEGEPGIPDVWLKIVDKDGNPVKDIYGNEVPPVKTDKNGKYLFEELPVLPEGDHYKVIIDREKSKKALAKYKPTTSNQGNREGDSDEWESTTEGLNNGGDEDLTLDFGFVLEEGDGIDVGGVGTTRPATPGATQPGTPGTPGEGIDVGGVGQTRPSGEGEGTAETGLNPAFLALGGAGLALALVGGLIVANTRRKPRRH